MSLKRKCWLKFLASMATLASILRLSDTLLTKFKVPLQFLTKRISYLAGFQYTRKLEIEILKVKANSS